MIKGVFYKNTPFVRISVGWRQIMQSPFFVLDTGFTGYLQITSKMAAELRLEPAQVIPVKVASGQIVKVPTAFAFANMESEKKYMEVLISDSLPLAGISLLSRFGYKAIVDCKYKTVELERVS